MPHGPSHACAKSIKRLKFIWVFSFSFARIFKVAGLKVDFFDYRKIS